MSFRHRVLLAIFAGFFLHWSSDDASAQVSTFGQQRDTASWTEQFSAAVAKLKGIEFGMWLDVPLGLEENTFWLVRNPPEYELKVQDFRRDSMHALILTKLLFLDTAKPRTKPAKFKVCDVVTISFDDSRMKLVGQYCECGGQVDDSIIALVEDTLTEYLEVVIRAWRVNKKLLLLEEIPTRGIRCLNMAYGD